MEDDAAVLRLLTKMLGFSGVLVSEACNGEQALGLLRAPSPECDLVVLDLVLPKLGGMAVRSLLRSEKPDLPILTMSGVEPVPAGLDPIEYIAKPFTIPAFFGRLQLLLGRRMGNI